MTITVGTGSSRTRFISKRYPVTEGITAGTTKLRKKQFLEVQDKSTIRTIEKVGLSNGR